MTSFRYAARSLARARAFSVATIATIALGIGAGCAVFGLVNAVLLRPLPYPDSERLVGLWNTMPGLNIQIAKQSPGTYAFYNESAKSLEKNALYFTQPVTLRYNRPDIAPERVRTALVTSSIFNVLGARPLIGRLLSSSDGMHRATLVTVIGERLWRDRFGADPHVLGQRIDVDGQQVQIVGVMPRSFAFPDLQTLLWISLDVSNPINIDGFAYGGIAKLRSGATVESTQRELSNLLTRLPERFPTMRSGASTAAALQQIRLSPIVHRMRDDVVKGFDHVLWLIAGTVALLVIVAFSNVAALLLVRIEFRQREFAVRSALGASSWGVWRSLMVETVIVATLGGVIGLGIASAALQLLVKAGPANLPRLNEVHVDAMVVVAALVLSAMFTAMSGAIGAVRIRSKDAMRILRDGGRTGTSGRAAQRMRAMFVGVEVALSLVLLAGSGVLARSVVKLRAVQPGFDASNTFSLWTFVPPGPYQSGSDVARFYDNAIARIQRIPGVVAAAATSKLPLEIEGTPYEILIWADDGSSTSTPLPPIFQATSTTAGYFTTMRIPLIAGRSFDDANVRRGVYESVVSKGLVEHYWHDSTGRVGVGKRIRLATNAPWYTIVGVVDDIRDSTLTEAPISEAYFPQAAADDSTIHGRTTREMAFVVRTRGPVAELQQKIERELHALDPNIPIYRPAAMDDLVTDARSRMTFALLLLSVGAGATLMLGVVGLYGVIAYVVGLRAREISIRIALGLAPANATRMILKQGETIVITGAAVGVAVFILFARLLNTLAFGISTVDAPTLAGALLAVSVVSTIATWIPARRAGKVDPAEALKAD